MITTDCDRVIVSLKHTDIQIPYVQAIKISEHILSAAKQAMRMAKEDVRECDKFVVSEPPGEIILSPTKKKSTLRKFDWSIKVRDWDENVYLYLGNIEVVMHFSKAIDFASQLKKNAKNAKNWAGHDGGIMTTAGWLNDAEFLYKYGIV